MCEKIKNICKFLQTYVDKLCDTDSECFICNIATSEPHLTSSMEQCIMNVYEPRPQNSNVEENIIEKKNNHNDASVPKKLVLRPVKTFAEGSATDVDDIEKRAEELWKNLIDYMKTRYGRPCNMIRWCDLKLWQKMPFRWALSNEILYQDPLDNYKRYYIEKLSAEHTLKKNKKLQNEEALITWYELSPKQRLPFVMESIIYKIGTNELSIADREQIRRIIDFHMGQNEADSP